MERSTALSVLGEHQPAPGRRWLPIRRRCAACGLRYPCPSRRAALDVLTGGLRPYWRA